VALLTTSVWCELWKKDKSVPETHPMEATEEDSATQSLFTTAVFVLVLLQMLEVILAIRGLWRILV